MRTDEMTFGELSEFARRDDCLDQMVPSDLRLLVGQIGRLRVSLNDAINSPKGVVPDSAAEFYDGREGRVR